MGNRTRKTAFLFAFSAAIALSGCTTVRGSQERVGALTPSSLTPANTALEAFYSPDASKRSGMSRRDYRDYISGSFESAVDMKFLKMVESLMSTERGTGLALDTLLQGLISVTALAGAGDIDELAAATSFVAGTRSNIDKRLFFERTLPALIASMEAERLSIKGDMARKRALNAEQYRLDEALDDVRRLQAAGSLASAIGRMTDNAQDDLAAQQARLETIIAACDGITAKTGELNRRFRLLVRPEDNGGDTSRLVTVASELGISSDDGTSPLFSVVASSFDQKFCNDTEKEEFLNKLDAQFAENQ